MAQTPKTHEHSAIDFACRPGLKDSTRNNFSFLVEIHGFSNQQPVGHDIMSQNHYWALATSLNHLTSTHISEHISFTFKNHEVAHNKTIPYHITTE